MLSADPDFESKPKRVHGVAEVAVLMSGAPAGANFKNPLDKSTGSGNAWVDPATWTATLATGSTTRGITAYGDSANQQYQVAGRGTSGDLALVLSSGR